MHLNEGRNLSLSLGQDRRTAPVVQRDGASDATVDICVREEHNQGDTTKEISRMRELCSKEVSTHRDSNHAHRNADNEIVPISSHERHELIVPVNILDVGVAAGPRVETPSGDGVSTIDLRIAVHLVRNNVLDDEGRQ